MARGSRGTASTALRAMALLPAVIFACVVLLQGATLSTPSATSLVGKRPYGVSGLVWRKVQHRVERPLAKISSDQSDAVIYGWIGVILAALLGTGLAVAGSRQGKAPRVDAGAVDAGEDRSILVSACIEVSDTVPSASHREELLDALERAGVQAVEVAPGEPFDSKRHKAAGRVPTTERERENLVAETERPGFIDRGRHLRPPSVWVYDVAHERSI